MAACLIHRYRGLALLVRSYSSKVTLTTALAGPASRQQAGCYSSMFAARQHQSR